jgi:hypothetical protein
MVLRNILRYRRDVALTDVVINGFDSIWKDISVGYLRVLICDWQNINHRRTSVLFNPVNLLMWGTLRCANLIRRIYLQIMRTLNFEVRNSACQSGTALQQLQPKRYLRFDVSKKKLFCLCTYSYIINTTVT